MDSINEPLGASSVDFSKYSTLKICCEENTDYFMNDNSNEGQRIKAALICLMDHIDLVQILIEKVSIFVHEYDFDENTPGNGYRSFIVVSECCIEHALKLCQKLTSSRTSILFRKSWFMKETETCSHLLASVCTCLQYLLILHAWSENGDLFPNGIHSPNELFTHGATIDQNCFYGRCLGFQFCQSMRGVLRFIATCMAGFSESYYSSSGFIAKTTVSVISGGKYMWNPELRAKRIVNISQKADVDFCKAFWFLAESELMQKIPAIVGSSIKVNRIISIPPEPLQLEMNESCELINIPIPSSHLGPLSVPARLLSFNRRKGMIGECDYRNVLPPSKSLIIHCHGGGFVAQSSKSHEIYLRDWAAKLDTPILSIDYSLAPEAPYPRASEEVFYAYCWALKNCALLGSLGEQVILVGDSAGANLNVGVVLKCIDFGIRKPDGLFIAYCPFVINFVPSPARLLCLLDPLLPLGFMMSCLEAYACPSSTTTQEDKSDNKPCDNVERIKENILCTQDCRGRPEKILVHLNTSKSEYVGLSSSEMHQNGSFAKENVGIRDDLQTLTGDSLQSIIKLDRKHHIDEFLKENPLNVPKTSKLDMVRISAEEDILLTVWNNIFTLKGIQKYLNKLKSNMLSTLWKAIIKITLHKEFQYEQVSDFDAVVEKNSTDNYNFEVPKDPYMSPYYANDNYLQQLPRTSILTVEMDPCLDDCVMLAKKLKRLGVPVKLDIIKGLPHGFLNLVKVSKEANEGSELCIALIKDLLNVGT